MITPEEIESYKSIWMEEIAFKSDKRKKEVILCMSMFIEDEYRQWSKEELIEEISRYKYSSDKITNESLFHGKDCSELAGDIISYLEYNGYKFATSGNKGIMNFLLPEHFSFDILNG